MPGSVSGGDTVTPQQVTLSLGDDMVAGSSEKREKREVEKMSRVSSGSVDWVVGPSGVEVHQDRADGLACNQYHQL